MTKPEAHTASEARMLFEDPDSEYGPIPYWWWDGAPLDRDRLTDQLEALAAGGIGGVCIISKYPTGIEGDRLEYFSEEWWGHLEHVAEECARLDMQLWVHDETYHHSPDWKRYWQNRIRTETSADERIQGHVLDRVSVDVDAGDTVELDLPASLTPLQTAAYPRDSGGRVLLSDGQQIDPGGKQESPGHLT